MNQNKEGGDLGWLEPFYCLLAANQYKFSYQELHRLAEKEHEQEPLNRRDVEHVAHQLRVFPLWQQVSWRKMHKAELPALITLKNGEAVVLLALNKDYAEVALFRNQEVSRKQVSIKSLQKSYAGEIMTISAEQKPIHLSNRIQISEWINLKTLVFSFSQLLLLSLLINVFQLALPLYTMNVYDKVLTHQVEETLWVLFSGVILIFILDYVFRLVRGIILEDISERVGESCLVRLFRKNMTANRKQQAEIGETSEIIHEIDSYRAGFFGKTVIDIIEFPFFFLFFAVIYGISPSIAMVPLYACMAIGVLHWFHHFPLRRLNRKLYPMRKEKESFLVQALSGREGLKLSNALSRHINLWQSKIREVLTLSRRVHLWNNSMTNSLPIVVQLVSAIVILMGAYQNFQGQLSVGGLIAVTLLSGRAILPVLNFSGAVVRLIASRDSLREWKKMLTEQTDYDVSENMNLNVDFTGEVMAKGVSFKYQEEQNWALKNIKFHIQKGGKVGIVGPSGAGKSTLLRLVSHLEKPDQGTIQLDGFAIESIHPYERYNKIAYMPQNPDFFSDSVYENIRLGGGNAASERIQEMVKIFNLNNLATQDSVSGGLSFLVGERGRALSGGQRQLVALMRTLSTDSVLYLLDEPTVGMDAQLEKKVIEYIKKLLKEKSLILVTHRPNLLELVDTLIVMNQGEIQDEGPKGLMLEKYFSSPVVPLRAAKVV